MVFASNLSEIVFQTVSATNEYVEALDDLLKTDGKGFVFPRETVVTMQKLLKANASLTKDLFEENQTIMDGIEDHFRKHPPEEKEDGQDGRQHSDGNPDS